MRIPSQIRVARATTEFLHRELSLLSPAQWETPGACGVWSVAEVAAHLTWCADMYREVIDRALAGILEPPPDSGAIADYAARSAWFAEKARTYRAELAGGLLDAYLTSGIALIEQFERLALHHWERQAPHPSSLRSVHDLLVLRILELAIHRYDILHRLGLDDGLPDGTHETIVSGLLTRISGSFDRQEPLPVPLRYRFVLASPLSREVRVVIHGDRLDIDPPGADDEPDAVLTMHPDVYILAFSGRLAWSDALAAGEIGVTGRRELVPALSVWFRPG